VSCHKITDAGRRLDTEKKERVLRPDDENDSRRITVSCETRCEVSIEA